jgi:S1-C subfamily serine protease
MPRHVEPEDPTMKRTIPIVVGAALVLSACSGLTPRTDDGGKPVSFPTQVSRVPPGDETSIESVVTKVLPAVVNVVTDFGEGTGFIVRQDGIVVTNYHVVEGGPSSIQVLTSEEEPTTYEARVIGGDVESDLAVLDIDAEGLPTVPLGSSEDLRLGQEVVAIGYALGLQGGPSVTSGIVSSLTRHITVNDPNCRECETAGQRTYGQVIQTDAAINPGNSGGPLVDLAGNVVGINSAGNSSAENVGFAIQIDAAKPVIFDAAENPDAPVAFMGIGATDASDPQFAFQFDPATTSGAGIFDVVQDSPASDAGVQVGDVVVGFDGQEIANGDDLRDAIRSHAPGDEVQVELVRGDQRITVTVTLGTNPVPTS